MHAGSQKKEEKTEKYERRELYDIGTKMAESNEGN